MHWVKIVQIRIFSWSVFSVFGLNTEIYHVNVCIQSEYGKIRREKTPYKDTSQTVLLNLLLIQLIFFMVLSSMVFHKFFGLKGSP